MNVIYKIFAFLMLIAIKINEKSASYIYQEINQSLASVKQINFSMFMKNLNGVVLYAVDHSDRILIELEKVNGVTEMVYTDNKHSIRRNIHSICGCWNCYNIYMEWRIELTNRRLSIQCRDVISVVTASDSQIKNSISAFPIPKNYDKIYNQTFLMIGNIGPFIGISDINYLPFKNQLVGCLHEFYINGNRIYFYSNGYFFNTSCPNEYNETICGPNNCTQSTVKYKINECTIIQLNRRYCPTNLIQFYEEQEEDLKKGLRFARVDWLIDPLNVYTCLIEFEMKSGYFISFHVNYQHLLMEIINKTYGRQQAILKPLTAQSIETMLFHFTDKDAIIQLSSGEDIKTYIKPIASEPISIRIGSSSKITSCKAFQGRMNFQMKYKRIALSSSLHTTNLVVTPTYSHLQPSISNRFKVNDVQISMIAGMVFVVLVLILLTFYVIIRRQLKEHVKNIECDRRISLTQSHNRIRDIPLPNIYENPDKIYEEIRISGE